MQNDEGRALDLFGATPRVPPAPESKSGATYARLAIVLAIVFMIGVVPGLLPDRPAAAVVRWLLVLADAGILLGLFRFFRVAWQFRGDDKVPLVLAALLGGFVTWRLTGVLNGRDTDMYLGRGLRFHVAGAPYRWMGYPIWEAFALTVLSVALDLSGLWLVTSVGGYLKQEDKAAAVVVAAASFAFGVCVWLIVN